MRHGPSRGALTYADRNLEKGMLWCRCFGSLMRLAWKWLRRRTVDPDTGSHYMIAVAWNAFAIYTYCVLNIGKDDRPDCRHLPEPVGEPACGRVVSAKPPVHR